MRGRPYLVFFLALVLTYLTVLLLVAVLVVHPSPLGWVGFGVAATVGLLIGSLASVLYPRSRTNAPRQHPHPGGLFRLLVVADAHSDGDPLPRAVQQRLAGRSAEVLVVSPVLASPLHFLTDAEHEEQDDARVRLGEALHGLGGLDIPARGMLGSDDPLQAIGDALAGFPADEILLVMPGRQQRRWLERELEHRVRDAYGVHISSLTLDDATAVPRA